MNASNPHTGLQKSEKWKICQHWWDSKRVFWPSWEIWSCHALHLLHQQCKDVSLQVATQCGHVVWLRGGYIAVGAHDNVIAIHHNNNDVMMYSWWWLHGVTTTQCHYGWLHTVATWWLHCDGSTWWHHRYPPQYQWCHDVLLMVATWCSCFGFWSYVGKKNIEILWTERSCDNIYGHELTPTPTADWESNALEKLKFCVQ